MIGKFKKLPLEKQLVWSFFLLASFVIALTMTISVFVDIRSERQQIDNTIGNIAEYVASLDSVVDMLEKGYPDPDVQHQMDSLCDAMKNVNNMTGYSTVMIGLIFILNYSQLCRESS